MTDVLQCPYCDLRFTSSSELDQHKAFDHPGKDEQLVPDIQPPDAEESPAEVEAPAEKQDEGGFFSRLFKRS